MCLSIIILADFVFIQFRFDAIGACLKQVMAELMFYVFCYSNQKINRERRNRC